MKPVKAEVFIKKTCGPTKWVDPWILHFLPDDEMNS